MSLASRIAHHDSEAAAIEPNQKPLRALQALSVMRHMYRHHNPLDRPIASADPSCMLFHRMAWRASGTCGGEH